MTPLLLRNNVDEASYLARIPKQPLLQPLTLWEMQALGYPLDVQQFRLVEDFQYYSDRAGLIVVPAGLITDLASIPQSLQNALQNDSPCILCGAVVHDYLYSVAGGLPDGRVIPFGTCNEILCEAMWYSNATHFQISGVYEAVDHGGRAMWNRDCDRLGHPERKA